MAKNAKKVDWAALLRLLIVVLSAVVEVIGEDNDEESEAEKKNEIGK